MKSIVYKPITTWYETIERAWSAKPMGVDEDLLLLEKCHMDKEWSYRYSMETIHDE